LIENAGALLNAAYPIPIITGWLHQRNLQPSTASGFALAFVGRDKNITQELVGNIIVLYRPVADQSRTAKETTQRRS